jgi:hypothetical protein
MSSEFCNFATVLLLSHLLGEVFCRNEAWGHFCSMKCKKIIKEL